MRKVQQATLVGVVKNGVVHISTADSKRVFGKVRITTNTAKSSKKIEAIVKAFSKYPNFALIMSDVQKVEPNAFITLKGNSLITTKEVA